MYDVRAQPNLTPEQQTVVQSALTLVSTRMFNAANRGDTNAVQAMEVLQRYREMKQMR